MEDPKSPAQTVKQSQADPEAEEAPTAHVLGSPSARRSVEQTTTATGGTGDGEGPTSTKAGSATMPETMLGSAGPSGAETVVASEAAESGSARLGALEELTMPPKGSQVMLRPTVWP